jgi:hypothetical protein
LELLYLELKLELELTNLMWNWNWNWPNGIEWNWNWNWQNGIDPMSGPGRRYAVNRKFASWGDVAFWSERISDISIYRLNRRVREIGSTHDWPGSDQRRVTTPDKDRYIRIQHLRDRFLGQSYWCHIVFSGESSLRYVCGKPSRPYLGWMLRIEIIYV